MYSELIKLQDYLASVHINDVQSKSIQFNSIQSLSHVWLSDAIDSIMLGFPVPQGREVINSRSLLKLMSIE